MGKICFNTFSPFKRQKGKVHKRKAIQQKVLQSLMPLDLQSPLAEHRCEKNRGPAITRKDYVLSRKGGINHSSTDNLTRKSVKVRDSTYRKENMSKNYYKNVLNFKNKTLSFNNTYHIISRPIYFAKTSCVKQTLIFK